MFALLHHRLGMDHLLALLREFYQRHVESGATSEEFADFIVTQAPGAKQIVDEWFLGSEYSNLILGEPNFASLIQRYQPN